MAKGAKNIGFDFFEEYCARLPDFSSEDFPMHRVILGAGVVIMEGLTNLGALPRRRVDFAAPFYKIAGTEGAPGALLRHRMSATSTRAASDERELATSTR